MKPMVLSSKLKPQSTNRKQCLLKPHHTAKSKHIWYTVDPNRVTLYDINPIQYGVYKPYSMTYIVRYDSYHI